MRVTLERLEPFGGVAGAILQLQDFEVPLRLIFVERGFEAEAFAIEHVGKLDRILERELGAGADREMRSVRGVAQEDDVAAGPALALDAAEVQPCGTSDEVRRVR